MKRKWLLVVIALVVALALVLSACDDKKTPCTTHVDADSNGICDVCGEEVQVTPPVVDPVYSMVVYGSKTRTVSLEGIDELSFIVNKDNNKLAGSALTEVLNVEISDKTVIAFNPVTGYVQGLKVGTSTLTLSLKDIDTVEAVTITYNVVKPFWSESIKVGDVTTDVDSFSFDKAGQQPMQAVYEKSTQFVLKGEITVNLADFDAEHRVFGIGSFRANEGGGYADKALWFGLHNATVGNSYDNAKIYVKNWYNGWGATSYQSSDQAIVLEKGTIPFELVRDGATYYYTIGNFHGKYVDQTLGAEEATHAGFFAQDKVLSGANCTYTMDAEAVATRVGEYAALVEAGHSKHLDADQNGICDIGGEAYRAEGGEVLDPIHYTLSYTGEATRTIVFGQTEKLGLALTVAGQAASGYERMDRITVTATSDILAYDVATDTISPKVGATSLSATTVTFTFVVTDKADSETVTVTYNITAPLWSFSPDHVRGDITVNADDSFQFNGNHQFTLSTFEPAVNFKLSATLNVPAYTNNESFGIGAFKDEGNYALWFALQGTGVENVYNLYILNFLNGWDGRREENNDPYVQVYKNIELAGDINFELVRVGTSYRYTIGHIHGEYTCSLSVNTALHAGFLSQNKQVTGTNVAYTTEGVQAAYDAYTSKKAATFSVDGKGANYDVPAMLPGGTHTLQVVRFPEYTAPATFTLEAGNYESASEITLTDEGVLTIGVNAKGGEFVVVIAGGGYTIRAKVIVSADASIYTLAGTSETRTIVFGETDNFVVDLMRGDSKVTDAGLRQGLIKVVGSNDALIYDVATGTISRNPAVNEFTNETATFTFSINGKTDGETITLTYTIQAPFWSFGMNRGEYATASNTEASLGTNGQPTLSVYQASTTFAFSGNVVIANQPAGDYESLGFTSNRVSPNPEKGPGDFGLWIGLNKAEDLGYTVKYRILIKNFYNGWAGSDSHPYTEVVFAKGASIPFTFVRDGANYRFSIGTYNFELVGEANIGAAEATYAGIYSQNFGMTVSDIALVTDAAQVKAIYDAFATKDASIFTVDSNADDFSLGMIPGGTHSFAVNKVPAFAPATTFALVADSYQSASEVTLTDEGVLTIGANAKSGTFDVKVTNGTKIILVTVTVDANANNYTLGATSDTRTIVFGEEDSFPVKLMMGANEVTDATLREALINVVSSNDALVYDLATGKIRHNGNTFANETATFTFSINGKDNSEQVVLTYTIEAPFWNLGLANGDHVDGDHSVSFTAGGQQCCRVTYASATTWAFSASIKLDQSYSGGQQFGIGSMLDANNHALWLGLCDYVSGTTEDTYSLWIRQFYGGWAGNNYPVVSGLKVAKGQPIQVELVRVGTTYYYTVGSYHGSLTDNGTTAATYAGVYSQTMMLTATNCNLVTDADEVQAIVAGYATKEPISVEVSDVAAGLIELEANSTKQFTTTAYPTYLTHGFIYELDKTNMTAGAEGTTITDEGLLTIAEGAAGSVLVKVIYGEGIVATSFTVNIAAEKIITENDTIAVKGGAKLSKTGVVTFPDTHIGVDGVNNEWNYFDADYSADLKAQLLGNFSVEFTVSNYVTTAQYPKLMLSLGGWLNQFYITYFTDGTAEIQSYTISLNGDGSINQNGGWNNSAKLGSVIPDFSTSNDYTYKFSVTDGIYHIYIKDASVADAQYVEIPFNNGTIIRNPADLAVARSARFATREVSAQVSNIVVNNGTQEQVDSIGKFIRYGTSASSIAADGNSFTMTALNSNDYGYGDGWPIVDKMYNGVALLQGTTTNFELTFDVTFSGAMSDGKLAICWGGMRIFINSKSSGLNITIHQNDGAWGEGSSVAGTTATVKIVKTGDTVTATLNGANEQSASGDRIGEQGFIRFGLFDNNTATGTTATVSNVVFTAK